MSTFAEKTGDHARDAVPSDQAVSGWRIALIVTGISIGLPLMLTGTRLATDMGGRNAIAAFFLGGMILAAIGCLTGTIGARQRVSTYVIIQRTFGRSVATFINGLLAFSILSWFAITAAVFGRALEGMLFETLALSMSGNLLTLAGILLMVLTTIFGFKALDRLALFAVPALTILLGYMAVAGFQAGDVDLSVAGPDAAISFGHGLSMVVGSWIVGMVVLPDWCRYCLRATDGVVAAVASMALAYPLLLSFAAIPALTVRETDIIALLFALGAGAPILLLLVLGTWTTNACNLYSGSLALATLIERVPRWQLSILGGVIGAVIAVSGIADRLTDFLLTLSVVITPIAGIYIVDHFALGASKADQNAEPRQWRLAALLAWFAGSIAGFVASIEAFTITSMPAADALLAATGCFYVLERLYPGKRSQPERDSL